MEESRKHILKTSKLIRVAIYIGMVMSAGGAAFALMLGFLPYDESDLPTVTENFVGSSNLLPTDVMMGILGDTELRLQIRMASVFIALLLLLVLWCINDFRKIFKHIIKVQTPFTEETYKAFRRLSIKTLFIALFTTLLGIFVFLLLRLVSYVFEYGTYLQEKADETNRIQEEMIMSFAEITENKSEQTGKHVRRVAEYSKIMALEMGMEEEQANRIRLASTMHDIGKLLIAPEILEKPARLTEEEFREIKKHPGFGGKMLDHVEGDVMQMAKTVALEHHERPDGKGYPSGKTGEELSLEGQIVAVADVYDALTSKRSYKEPWNEQDAYNEILKGKGTQFDTAVVEAFEKAYSSINAIRAELQG